MSSYDYFCFFISSDEGSRIKKKHESKITGKILNMNIIFSVNIFYYYKCYQKASEAPPVLTVKEVLCTNTL